MITLERLNGGGLRHGFFTREGGSSGGIYASNNCGFGSSDDPERVAENRRRSLAQIGLPPETLVTVHQVHGVDVAVAEKPWPPKQAPHGDALVTDRPGVALGILAADCAPILFADATARVIGAAHAGWRGALAGVGETTVAVMRRLGARPENIAAAIGPCIARRSYEVGPEFPAPFLKQDARNGDFFAPAKREKHFMFDLAGYLTRRLTALGLKSVETLSNDTCGEERRFFSYRRATLRGEKDYGRNLSVIALEK